MSKYSIEFKSKVVKYCIEGHHGFKTVEDYFNIPAKITVQKYKSYKEWNGFYKKYCKKK